jgi:membrane protease YdiL (CAAX protease family)
MDEPSPPSLISPPVPISRVSAVAAPRRAPTEATPAPPRPALPSVACRFWDRHLRVVRARADAESDAARAADRAGVDRAMVVVLLTSAVALTANNFLNGPNVGWLTTPLRGLALDGVARRLDAAMTTSGRARFNELAFWAVVQVLTYVVPAVLVIRFVLRRRVRDFGLRVRSIAPHGRVYLAVFAVALPAIVFVSYGSAFQAKYPFYKVAPDESLWPYLVLWWGLYALQFVALEFFFRGFMVHGLAPRFGWAAVFVMVVPYNMLHYGKPMPEALAAIVGGVVLGVLSLETKSIWWGAGLHIAIALTMDVLALSHAGRLF